MKGSEKQIKWAEDIKINILAIIADGIFSKGAKK